MKHYLQVFSDRVGRGVFPVQDIRSHLRAAAEWLLRAQRATPDDGVAHSYDVRGGKWHPSYPETTGYIIPTLYDYACHYGASEFAEAAYRMAVWEANVQLPDGGVRAGHMEAEVVVPTIFNTGQVLFGWARAYLESKDERLRLALERGADWLVAAQDDDGAWRKFSSPFTTVKLNTYNTRSAFGLVRAYQVLGHERYLASAERNVRWAVARAHANAWLPDNSLTVAQGGSALTHTIAYSIRGILEVGQAVDKPEYVEHAARMAIAVASRQRKDGALPGYLMPNWTPAATWTCVTGNSQMAINWLRLARLTCNDRLIDHARRANRFNMSIQDIGSRDSGIRGGLKGSHPVDGEYMRYRYPNWATKFFMDGLMLEDLGDKVENIG